MQVGLACFLLDSRLLCSAGLQIEDAISEVPCEKKTCFAFNRMILRPSPGFAKKRLCRMSCFLSRSSEWPLSVRSAAFDRRQTIYLNNKPRSTPSRLKIVKSCPSCRKYGLRGHRRNQRALRQCLRITVAARDALCRRVTAPSSNGGQCPFWPLDQRGEAAKVTYSFVHLITISTLEDAHKSIFIYSILRGPAFSGMLYWRQA